MLRIKALHDTAQEQATHLEVQAAQLAVGANGDSTRWAGSLIGSGALVKLGTGRFLRRKSLCSPKCAATW